MASGEDIAHHVKVYRNVYVALMVLTAITVGLSLLHMTVVLAVAAAMIVATVKGSLVASYFMHLKDERPAIYWILILTAIFFVCIMALPLLTYLDQPHV